MTRETTIELIKHDLSKLTRPSVTGFVRYLIMNASFKPPFGLGYCMKGKNGFYRYIIWYMFIINMYAI